jgi:hypothetical protein
MSTHDCKTLTDGCYRCDLNRDEMQSVEDDVRKKAQAAWLAYRNDFQRKRYLTGRQTASQMRRRDFIAGYLAANEIAAVTA